MRSNKGTNQLLSDATMTLRAAMAEETDEEGRTYWVGSDEDRKLFEGLVPDLEAVAGTGPDRHPGLLIYSRRGGIHGGTDLDMVPPSRGWVLEVSWAGGDITRRWFRRQDAARAALLLVAFKHGGTPSETALSADLSPMNAQFSSDAFLWPCDRFGERRRKAA